MLINLKYLQIKQQENQVKKNKKMFITPKSSLKLKLFQENMNL